MKFSNDQNRIIQHDGGHAIIMACPGAGKTSTLAQRIVYLLRNGADPRRITVMMFGSSAQKDFVSRLKKAAGDEFESLPDIRTFHSLCLHLCKFYAKRGLIGDYKLEPNDKVRDFMAMEAIKIVMAEQAKKENKNQKKSYISNDMLDVDTFVSFIDMVKSTLKSPREVFKLMKINDESEVFIDAYSVFEEIRNEEKIRFFSDLIYDLVVLIRDNSDAASLISNHKDYIIVDEYQDTNYCQAVLLKILAGERAKVMVVGDVDQAIYEWRGGDPKIMLHDFKRDFPGCEMLPLTETFRYGSGVSIYANNLIQNNKERFPTVCKSNDNCGESEIHLVEKADHGREAVRIVRAHQAKGKKLSDIAVLVRMYSHSASIELAFIEAGIEYYISNGIEFLKSNEAKTLLSIMELSSGMFKEMSENERCEKIKSILKFPHIGLKNDVICKIAAKMAKKDGGYFDDIWRMLPPSVNKFHKEKISERGIMLSEIEHLGKSRLASRRATESIVEYYIKRTDLFDWIQSSSLIEIDADESIKRCSVFSSFVEKTPGSIHEKIEKIKSMASKEKDANAEHVLITSIHKSKGLEWDTVIIPSLEEKSFPYFYNNQPPDMEAERRLFFVGVTRCIKNVHLLTSVPREKYIGKREDYRPKSRFISELKMNDRSLELGHISKIDDKLTSNSRLEIIRKTAISLSAIA